MSTPVRVATITSSDTRTPDDDDGGRLLGERLVAAGFVVASHAIVREDDGVLGEAIDALLKRADVDAIVITGGTGVAPRDRTFEAVMPRLEKTIDGFGEAFRRLSWDEIGPASILSRAVAGVAARKVIVALPGSVNAVRLAVDSLLAPTLAHAVGLASGRATHHAKKSGHRA
ncbi:MAG TPA: molybdenum cofactor biosynthesis protein B [Byssovorax sp.]|jgi:molybdenum cofactor biosynthesis protein B